MYLTLRTGGERHGRKNPLPLPYFAAVTYRKSAPEYPQGKGVIHKRVETAGVYPLVRPRGVSAISLASQAAKCDFCFAQSAQTTTPSGGAAMPEACFSSNYSVSQPVPPAGKFSFYGIIVPQFFRRFLHKMMKDFLRQHRTIKAAALCGNFMS